MRYGLGEDLIPGTKYKVTINEDGVSRVVNASAVSPDIVKVGSGLPGWVVPAGAGAAVLLLLGVVMSRSKSKRPAYAGYSKKSRRRRRRR